MNKNYLTKENAIQKFIWTKNFSNAHLQNIKNIFFFIHPLYESHPTISLYLSFLISFFRDYFSIINYSSFTTSTEIQNNYESLYILLYHPDMNSFIKQLPHIYILVNIFDLHSKNFISQQNIVFFSKAYKIIDTKYINLQFYLPNLKNYLFYLPIIYKKNIQNITLKNSIDVLFFNPSSQRSSFFYNLLQKNLIDKNYSVSNDFDDFYDSKIIVLLNDSPQSYYNNILFSQCIQHKKLCISEKCNDIYHENYYFDKIIFQKELQYNNLQSIQDFTDKIIFYLTNNEKYNEIIHFMNLENYIRNENHFKLIFSELLK